MISWYRGYDLPIEIGIDSSGTDSDTLVAPVDVSGSWALVIDLGSSCLTVPLAPTAAPGWLTGTIAADAAIPPGLTYLATLRHIPAGGRPQRIAAIRLAALDGGC